MSAINTLSKILEIIFFNKRTSNKDAEEGILAIHINVINMVNAFTSLIAKDIRSILLLQTNDKYKAVKRKPVVEYVSVTISCILSYLEQTLSQFVPSFSCLYLY